MDALLSSLPGHVQAIAAFLTDRQPLPTAPGRVWHGPLEASAATTSNWLAWTLLLSLLLTFSVIGACIIALRQRPRSPTPEQLLIEEVLRDPHAAEHGLPPSPLQPWERPPDWWKQNQP
jgi:hypothetical protein